MRWRYADLSSGKRLAEYWSAGGWSDTNSASERLELRGLDTRILQAAAQSGMMMRGGTMATV